MTPFQGPCGSLWNTVYLSKDKVASTEQARIATLGKSMSHLVQFWLSRRHERAFHAWWACPSQCQRSSWVFPALVPIILITHEKAICQAPSISSSETLEELVLSSKLHHSRSNELHRLISSCIKKKKKGCSSHGSSRNLCALVSWSENSLERSPTAVKCPALPMPSYLSHHTSPAPPTSCPVPSHFFLLLSQTPRLSRISSFRAHDWFIQSTLKCEPHLPARLFSGSWHANSPWSHRAYILVGGDKK